VIRGIFRIDLLGGLFRRRHRQRTALGDGTGREALFPDWGLRAESQRLSASFDPFSLQLTHGLGPEVAEAGMALAAGNMEAARSLVRPLESLPRGKQVPYMLEVTQGLHEIRHFHDHFGTTAGFSRVVRTLRDAMAFSDMWQELRKAGRICLPLAAWAGRPDAPEVLRDYAAKRRAYVEWFNLHDGLILPHTQEMAEGNAEEGLVVVHMRNLHAVIPVVPLNVRTATAVESADGRSSHITSMGPRHQKIVPLGCSVMMEGTAFAIQRNVVERLFGHEAAEDVHSWMGHRASERMQPHLYTAVDTFLTRKWTTFYNAYQVAITDAALMPGPDQTEPGDHPGMRLARLVKAAADGPPSYRELPHHIATWASRLTREIGGPNPVRSARETQNVWTKRLRRPTEETFWDAVERAFLSLHVTFLARRLATPDLFADPWVWFRNLSSLPPPPIVGETGQLAFLVTPEHYQPIRGWYFFEHFQRHLLFGTDLPCAGHFHPHECPGDPFHTRNWKPLATCPFSQFLESTMNISGIRIERLRSG
jgi:hypothetical protein